MNKLNKAIIATLGAINVVYGILIPIAVALLLILVFSPNNLQTGLLALLGGLSSLYRAISVGFIKRKI